MNSVTLHYKMKKFVLILLISIYSLSTVGINLKEFYCCGKLKSVTLAIPNQEKKTCGKGDMKDDCCKTKVQSFKVKDSHLSTAQLTPPAKYFTDLQFVNTSWQPCGLAPLDIYLVNSSHAPPLYRGVPVYISNCVFRI